MQLDHQTRYGRAGSWSLYETAALGLVQRPAVDEVIETLIEGLRVSTLLTLLRKASTRFLEDADLGVVPAAEVVEKLQKATSDPAVYDLLGHGQEGTTLVDGWPRVLTAENRFRRERGLVGIPYPWPSLNAVTGGLSPGDYVTVLGFQKAGKSDFAVEVGATVARDVGEPVLFITNELSMDDILIRVACRWCQIPHAKFRQGALSDEQRGRLVDAQAQLRHHPRVAFEHTFAHGLAVIGQVRALTERHRAKLVIWDGHQLSAESDEWTDVYALSRRTRSLALEAKIPILITAQLNPKRTVESYKAYHQDCTVAVKIEREGNWMHCSTPDIREMRGTSWSVQVERGLPLVEQPYRQAIDPATTAAVSAGSVLA